MRGLGGCWLSDVGCSEGRLVKVGLDWIRAVLIMWVTVGTDFVLLS